MSELKDYYKRAYVYYPEDAFDTYMSKIGHVARLSNAILRIDKPDIMTVFEDAPRCNHYDYDYDYEVLAKTKSYFKWRNLQMMDTMIVLLSQALEYAKKISNNPVYALPHWNYSTWPELVVCTVAITETLPDRDCECFGVSDIEIILECYKEARSAFNKRLNSYWRRYGASKIRIHYFGR